MTKIEQLIHEADAAVDATNPHDSHPAVPVATVRGLAELAREVQADQEQAVAGGGAK